MRRIRDDERLVVGVAADTELLAARNAETGDIEGFDIDFAFEVAAGSVARDTDDQLRPTRWCCEVITAADRIPFLQDGTVDIVVRNMTVNCERWQQVAFSAIYYDAGQKVLVGKEPGLRDRSPADLAGQAHLRPGRHHQHRQHPGRSQPQAIPVSSTDNSACMVLFQNGEADGVSTDDTVLAGLAAQDPYAEVMKTELLTEEPYGIGVNSENDRPGAAHQPRLEQIRDERPLAGDLQHVAAARSCRSPASSPSRVYGR